MCDDDDTIEKYGLGSHTTFVKKSTDIVRSRYAKYLFFST